MPLQQTAHISFRYFIDFSDEFQTISSQVFIFISVRHQRKNSGIRPLSGQNRRLGGFLSRLITVTGVESKKNCQKSYLDGTYNEYQQVNEVKLQISQNLPRLKSLQQYHGKNGNISYDFCRNGQSFNKDFMFKVQ